jgi:hypothetical protein
MGAAAIVPFVTGSELKALGTGEARAPGAVFELRIYHCFEGKLELLLERFRTKETKIFARMGMHGVGYWTPTDEPLKGRTLVYILRHKSREAATESWDKFKVDPEWVKLKAESEAGGAFVEKHESTFMTLTDFSPWV